MMNMRAALALAILLSATILHAQQREKMCFQLKAHLERHHEEGAQLDVFIHGPSDMVGAAVRAHGGLVKQSLPRLVNARIPVASINALAADRAVEQFEFSLAPAHLLNDSARIKSRIDMVHAGAAPLPAAYTGKGVIMGIIDTGLDPTHPDLQHENGDTRVLKYWDQGLANGPLTPAEYGYGQVWDASHINNGTFTSVDQNGHGTTVAGIAAGNGLANGMHKGMAPEADLVIVKYRAGGNFTSNVADAVHYIFEYAESVGKPAVVNISLGRRLGSHDGMDAGAQFIDAMLQERTGRVVVCAAGNWNEWDPYHMRTNVTADTSFTWFAYNPTMNFGEGVTGGVYFEAWADAEDLQNVQYAVGADRASPTHQFRGRTQFRNVSQNLNTMTVDTLYSHSGHRIGVVQMMIFPRGGQYQLMVQMVQPDSSQYRFRFMSTGSGRFDVWSLAFDGWSQMLPHTWPTIQTVPSVAEYPPMANYVFPDNNQHITDSWTCSPHVITVGNYRNETGYIAFDNTLQQGPGTEGEITPSSSKGPTRDDRIKPDVGAPGDVTFSPPPMASLAWFQQNEPFKLAPGGMHVRGGGTSAASPHVAGAVALYLEKCPWAGYLEVRQALFSTAVVDQFTGMVPNSQWGNGKLDAFAMLNTSNLDDFQIGFTGDHPFCDGEQVLVSAPSIFTEYLWTTGDTGSASIAFGEAGPLSVTGFDASGCQARSDTLTFTVLPSPEAPQIMVDGATLTSDPAGHHQWYFNGDPIEGADQQVHNATENGAYHVVVTNEFDCSTASEAVVVIITDLKPHSADPIMIWPSPASDHLNVRLDEAYSVLVIHDANGRMVHEQGLNGNATAMVPLTGIAPGIYFLRIEGAGRSVVHRFVKMP